MTGLFAQFGPPAGGNAANNPFANPALFAGLLIAVLAVLFLVVFIFYLLTLQKALGRCRPQNRAMRPGMVWLNLIPFFSTLWQFVIVDRIADSLRNEFKDRDMHKPRENYGRTGEIRGWLDQWQRDMHKPRENYGRTVGMAYAWFGLINLICVGVYLAVKQDGNVFGGLLSPVTHLIGVTAFGCWITYWATIAGYSGRLARADRKDDRPRRRRSRRGEYGESDDRGRRPPYDR